MRIYQFTALQTPAVTARLLRASADANGSASTTVVLDLEDSLWDVTMRPEPQPSRRPAASR